MTQLQKRIIDALKASGNKSEYYDLMYAVWPQDKYPKAYRYKASGGPYPVAMHLGRALNELEKIGAVYFDRTPNRRSVRLRTSNAN